MSGDEGGPGGSAPAAPARDGVPARELAAIAEAEARASAARLKAARDAADAALEEQYQATAKELKVEEAADSFTDKRSGEVIFRRELGEPEFWLGKSDRAPPRPVLTEDQEREISRRAEVPTNQIPEYVPRRVLSAEFGGTSNYEAGLGPVREEAERRLAELRGSGAGEAEVRRAEEDVRRLDSLHENYRVGMSVFRIAKGGRDRAKK